MKMHASIFNTQKYMLVLGQCKVVIELGALIPTPAMQ